jgi:hypothetical protein
MTHMVHVSCVTVGNSRRLQLAGQVAGIWGAGTGENHTDTDGKISLFLVLPPCRDPLHEI